MYPSKKTDKKTNFELNPSVERLRGYALWMLGRQDYTEKKLREKMFKRFPDSDDMIETTIQGMIDDDYLNDQRFINRLVNSMVESGELGPSAMRNKLYVKGFHTSCIEEAMNTDIVSGSNFFEKALAFKMKKYGELPVSDKNIKRRALGTLVRKGFSFQDAIKALEHNPDSCC